MTPQELKNSILQLAIQGKLVEQRPEEGTAEELYREIQAEKQRMIKAGKIKKEKSLPEITDEEKPFDIPGSWKWVRLGNAISLLSGTDFKPSDYNDQGTGIPYITGASSLLSDGVLVNRWTERPTVLTYCGDVLLVCKGSGYGKTVICNIEKAHIARQIMAIRNLETLCMKYIRFFLMASVVQIKSNGQGVIPGIDRGSVLNMFFPLPPLTEQKRIVAKIEELLPYINRYEQAWGHLEDFNKRFPDDMKKSILQLAIQGKLVEQRPEEGTAEELYQQIQAEKQRLIKAGKIKKRKILPEISGEEVPFDIPKAWKWVRLGDIISVSSGDGLTSSEMSKNGEYPVYGGNGITGYHSAFNVSKRTLVIGRVGFYCGSTHITEEYAWVTDNAFITTFNEHFVSIKWLKHFIDYLEPRKKSSSTAQPVISGKLIYPMLMPLPPLAEQKRIVEKLEELLPLCERLK